MQKTLREKCKNKRRIEASMAEAFVVEEAANFVTTHYAATNHSLHHAKPRYTTSNPERRESKFKLFRYLFIVFIVLVRYFSFHCRPNTVISLFLGDFVHLPWP